MRYNEIIESIGDGEEDEPVFTSFGWWIYPDGELQEMEEEGDHGHTAHGWMTDHVQGYREEAYDVSIEDLKALGGIRVATFHGTPTMHIDYLPDKITKPAAASLLRLMAETRSMFVTYIFESDKTYTGHRYQAAVAKVRRA